MEPTASVLAAYEAALPDHPDVERKKMFGMPCAFVNRQMFFGTFDTSIVARIGNARAAALATEAGLRLFTPTEGRTWADYVQVDASADAALHRSLAAEAFAWTTTLPPKAKKPKASKKAARAG